MIEEGRHYIGRWSTWEGHMVYIVRGDGLCREGRRSMYRQMVCVMNGEGLCRQIVYVWKGVGLYREGRRSM